MSRALFIDECVPSAVAAALQAAGHVCVFASDVCFSAPDPEVAAAAKRLDLPLLTEDRGFGRLFLNNPDPTTTLILAMGAAGPSEKAARLLDLLSSRPEILRGGLCVIETDKVRHRASPAPDYTRPIA